MTPFTAKARELAELTADEHGSWSGYAEGQIRAALIAAHDEGVEKAAKSYYDAEALKIKTLSIRALKLGVRK